MSIVLASELCASDLMLLGNNLRPRGRRRAHGERVADAGQRARRRVLSAVNRSLASLRERVDCLDPAVAGPRALAT